MGPLGPASIGGMTLILALCGSAAVSRGAASVSVRPSTAGSLSSFEQVVPGRAPVFAWAERGEGAVAVGGVGIVGASPDQRRVPIASLTKMMTALVVLRDHPLAPGQAGPTFAMGAQDVEEWERGVRAGDSVVEVRAGEVLSEYQALEALLIPSADNVADRL